MRLIAVDPGDHLGIAVLDDKRSVLHTQTIIIEHVTHFRRVMEYIESMQPSVANGDVYIVEEFRLRKSRALQGSDLLTNQLVGVCQWQFRTSPLYLQQPNVQWRVTPQLLRTFRENFTPQTGSVRLPKITAHEISAIRHLMSWMLDERHPIMDEIMRYTMEGQTNAQS